MFYAVAVLAGIYGLLAVCAATEPSLWVRPEYKPATPSAARIAAYVRNTQRRVGAHGRGTL